MRSVEENPLECLALVLWKKHFSFFVAFLLSKPASSPFQHTKEHKLEILNKTRRDATG